MTQANLEQSLMTAMKASYREGYELFEWNRDPDVMKKLTRVRDNIVRIMKKVKDAELEEEAKKYTLLMMSGHLEMVEKWLILKEEMILRSRGFKMMMAYGEGEENSKEAFQRHLDLAIRDGSMFKVTQLEGRRRLWVKENMMGKYN